MVKMELRVLLARKVTLGLPDQLVRRDRLDQLVLREPTAKTGL